MVSRGNNISVINMRTIEAMCVTRVIIVINIRFIIVIKDMSTHTIAVINIGTIVVIRVIRIIST
jgi:hypothetical protein